MPRFTEAQLARKARRRFGNLHPIPPDAEEVLADLAAVASGPEPVILPTVPEDAQSTAKALLAWMDDAGSDDEHIARAEAVRAVNDARDRPWSTVAKAVDGILG